MTINLVLLMIFLFTTIFVIALVSFLRWLFLGKEHKVGERLDNFTREKKAGSPDMHFVIRDHQLSQIPILHRILGKIHVSKKLQDVLDQANIPMKVGKLVLLMLTCGAVGMLMSVGLGNPIIMILVFCVFATFPLAYVLHVRKKRMRRFTQQFPDALDLMTSALRAGHGFGRALQLVATEIPDPAGMEFRKTFEEHNLGLPTREALINFTNRVDSVDLKLFATAIIVQRESGGNLAEILTNISQTIRDRFRLLGQIRVYTTQGRLTAWILGSLPLLLGSIILVLDPEYMRTLLDERMGLMMLAAAFVLQVVGFILIRKIVRLKVQ